MQLSVSNASLADIKADWLVACVLKDEDLSDELVALDESLGGALQRMKERGDLKGGRASVCTLLDVPGLAADRVLLVGLGKRSALNVETYLLSVQEAARKICAEESRSAVFAVTASLSPEISLESQAELAATAFEVGGVSAALYKAEGERHPMASLEIFAGSGDAESISSAAERGSVIGQSVNVTRDLVNRPPNDIYPESFADKTSELAAEVGLGCEVLDEGMLREERMGSLMAVAQGSSNGPRVVVMKHAGGPEGEPPIALIGKGVTFDSGGLSLKPNEGMKTMKCDMAGAGTVVGVMTAISRLNLPVNVIGLVGLVENMPSGNSYKLGDVLTARNGVTIEVHNTDAEGRLVLADVLSYAVDLGATRLVDLATLTGACVVALGTEVTGVFTNDEDWSAQVIEAARGVGENVWPMPMYDSFNDQLKSQIADVKNVGTRWGGAVTAAKFLERFVSETPWVHLDIAGPSFADSSRAGVDAGATGCMVRGLVELCRRQS